MILTIMTRHDFIYSTTVYYFVKILSLDKHVCCMALSTSLCLYEAHTQNDNIQQTHTPYLVESFCMYSASFCGKECGELCSK